MLSRRLLREKVVKQVYACLQSDSKEMGKAEIELKRSVDRSYELYFHILQLLPLVADYAKQRIEIGLAKQLPTFEDLHPFRGLAESRIIETIASSTRIAEFAKSRKLYWKDADDLVRAIYTDLTESDFYREFTESKADLEAERVFLEKFLMEYLSDCPLLDEFLEEESSLWADDLGFVLTMVYRTVERCRPGKELSVLPQFKGEGEDMVFAAELLKTSIKRFDENRSLVDSVSSNWDIERVALMDLIILDVAVSELVSCPDIPVKVTLNEYIDIAKYYSTPSSSVYVNGVLDKLVNQLRKDGKIVKSACGLIDRSVKQTN